MSLKTFHVIFVAASSALSLGFGAWAIGDFRRSGEAATLAVGIASVIAAVALLVYGRWFLGKLKGIT